ncbi:hypothetical protein E4K63_03635 [Allofrancisella inopinata]|uniref:LPP20 lipoprotein n=2 Tax=Allofrancisella inopinata TaxID=1085647 RepID=A0AAE6YJN3_9GAMM|nr:hypothetical protein E4K63_03635 [Allofrancisella inopinata]
MSHGTGVIKMKKLNKLFLFCWVCLLGSCSSAYIDAKDDLTKVEFESGNYPKIFFSVRERLAQANLKSAIKSNNHIGNIEQLKNLNSLESGRLLQLNDQYQISIDEYNKALSTVATSKEEAIKQARAILLNKNTYDYYDTDNAYIIPDYAINFLYIYQALNYLKQSDPTSALKSLQQLDNAKFWTLQQDGIAKGMAKLAQKQLKTDAVNIENLGIKNFEFLESMTNFSDRIPNSYGNPMGYYLNAILESSISKDYNAALTSLIKAQQYTVGNHYLDQTVQEFYSAIESQTSPFPMGMGRIVVFYEQGLVNTRVSIKAPLDIGNIGVRKFQLPVYNTQYQFFEPKKVIISDNDRELVNTYTETLLDGTLFAIKSLVAEYPKVIMQNTVIEVFKYNYDKKFALGGLLGSKLKFDLSKTEPKEADLRSWLLLPNSVDLFEQQIDSGTYTIQINNIRQKISVQQGKTTLLWVVDIGSFKKVFYFII